MIVVVNNRGVSHLSQRMVSKMKMDRLAVRKARLRAGKTQLEVARKLKVTELKVSRWECGREPIRPEDAQRFILALDSEALVS